MERELSLTREREVFRQERGGLLCQGAKEYHDGHTLVGVPGREHRSGVTRTR